MVSAKKISAESDNKLDGLTVDELGELLASSSRRDRQNAAGRLATVSKIDPECLLVCKNQIIAALDCSEARTRWECLDALVNMLAYDPSICEESYDAVEESLFDEQNGTVRLAALRFLCKMGSISEEFAKMVWPILDEALQCYHGDPEYTDMLVAINEFASVSLPEEVAQGLVDRMTFDATNAKSGLLRRANSIIDAAKKSLPE